MPEVSSPRGGGDPDTLGVYSVSHFLAGMKQILWWDEGQATAPEAGVWAKEGGVLPTHEVAAGSAVQSLGIWQ